MRTTVCAALVAAFVLGGPTPSRGANVDATTFQSQLDTKFPKNRRIRLQRLSQKELLDQGHKLKGYYYVVDVSTVEFIRESKRANGKAYYLAWVTGDWSSKQKAPIAFELPDNRWFKKRKNRKANGGAGYKFTCSRVGGHCDTTTLVGEPNGKSVDLAVGPRNVVMRMPIVRVVGIGDKEGAWYPGKSKSAKKKKRRRKRR